jgi:hypothetical protein
LDKEEEREAVKVGREMRKDYMGLRRTETLWK